MGFELTNVDYFITIFAITTFFSFPFKLLEKKKKKKPPSTETKMRNVKCNEFPPSLLISPVLKCVWSMVTQFKPQN